MIGHKGYWRKPLSGDFSPAGTMHRIANSGAEQVG